MFKDTSTEATTVTLPPLAPRRNRLREIGFAVAAVATVALSQAGAQTGDIDSVIAPAQGAGDKVKTVVIALAIVVVTIGAITWAARHVKPKG